MQVKQLKKDGLSYELEVIVTAKDIDDKIDQRLAEVGKTMKMPGFRPGKVPLDILKKKYGRAVMGEVLELAVNDSTSKALQQQGLRPALQPRIEVKEFDEGKDLKYTMNVEVMPEFDVMDIKKIAVEKPVAPVDQAKIQETLERIAKQNRSSEPVKSARAAKNGDIVVIDFKGRTKAGKEYPGMNGEGHHLELGSNQFIPGFEDQLTGKKAGDKVEVNVTFPDPYPMAELAGAEAIFDVEIKEIREPKDPAIDEDFAKKLGFASLEKLREAVESQMKTEYDQFSRLKVKRAVLDALDEEHDFEIPAGMVSLEYEAIVNQIKTERQSQAELSKDEKEELQAIANRRVRLGMILSEVGRKNNIQVTDDELRRAVMNEARKYPGQEAQVFEFFRKNQQAIEGLRAPVFEDKVVDWILEQAKVTEKTVTLEDLTAEDEESYTGKKKGGAKKSSGGKKAEAADEASDEKPAVKKSSGGAKKTAKK